MVDVNDSSQQTEYQPQPSWAVTSHLRLVTAQDGWGWTGIVWGSAAAWGSLHFHNGYCMMIAPQTSTLVLLCYLPKTGFRTTIFTPLSCTVKWTQSVRVFAVSEVETLVHQRIIFSIWSQILVQNLLYVPVQQNTQTNVLLAIFTLNRTALPTYAIICCYAAKVSTMYVTRHRASTSMYSLTFRVRIMLPNQCNPCTVRKSAQ